MPTSADCLVCLVRQSLEAARLATQDESLHRLILYKVMELIVHEGTDVVPPIIGQKIHRLIREKTNNPDPYLQAFNSLTFLSIIVPRFLASINSTLFLLYSFLFLLIIHKQQGIPVA